MCAFLQLFEMPTDWSHTLPERMLRLRKLEGLTQSEVARELGLAQSTYALYEKGARNVPLKNIPALARALRTSEAELLGLNEQTSAKRGRASQLERRMAAIQGLPSPRQKEILKVIDALLAQPS